MEISEQELRAMVRDAIARSGAAPPVEPDPVRAFSLHASHGRLPLPSGGDGDGPCLIEPAVLCNHCGYCLSFGH
jgi:hypothetical protein